MISKNTDVRLIIKTEQRSGELEDSFENKYDAKLSKKEDAVYVTYTEDELCSIKQKNNTVTVSRHRSGTKLVFDEKEKYSTVYASLPVTVKTDRLRGSLVTDGRLQIVYRLFSSGTELCKNTVTIKIEEK